MGRHEIVLHSCTPDPLMNYLRAIGVLRLVAEQKDPSARGCWRADRFVLQTTLSQAELLDFFLSEYRPTPILAPWGADSGFYKKGKDKFLQAILNSTLPRLEPYRRAIRKAYQILQSLGLTQKPSEEKKFQLLCRLRAEMPDDFLRWMDAAFALQIDTYTAAPVLGTGGNDGRLDFSYNFTQRIVDSLQLHQKPPQQVREYLESALFAKPIPGLPSNSVGQFSPGRAGGANQAFGFDGDALDNPWDFVLMLEGTLLLAGALVRRSGIYSRDRAAFPFTVRARPVGATGEADADAQSSRGELWLPLWSRPASVREVEQLFAEGRAEYGGTPARDTLDFAKAVASLGVDRGIEEFTRYGFLLRNGRSYLAVALERFPVPQRPREGVFLIREIDAWLDRFRGLAGPNDPARYRTALHRIEGAIFDYCRYGRAEDLLQLLLAVGDAEAALAVTAGKRGSSSLCPPLPTLSGDWIRQTYDGSVEYDIARALSGIHDAEGQVAPIRHNVEPVELRAGRWDWTEPGPQVVWKTPHLEQNMLATLERRILDGARRGCRTLPLDSHYGVTLEALSLFLHGEIDDRKLHRLFRSLILVRPTGPRVPPQRPLAPPLPRHYALLKLLFLPAPIARLTDPETGRERWQLVSKTEEGITIQPEPRVLSLLRAGRLAEACAVAYQRLRAAGFAPVPAPMAGHPDRSSDWFDHPSGIDPRRIAAALLIPLAPHAYDELLDLVTRPAAEQAATALS